MKRYNIIITRQDQFAWINEVEDPAGVYVRYEDIQYTIDELTAEIARLKGIIGATLKRTALDDAHTKTLRRLESAEEQRKRLGLPSTNRKLQDKILNDNLDELDSWCE